MHTIAVTSMLSESKFCYQLHWAVGTGTKRGAPLQPDSTAHLAPRGAPAEAHDCPGICHGSHTQPMLC